MYWSKNEVNENQTITKIKDESPQCRWYRSYLISALRLLSWFFCAGRSASPYRAGHSLQAKWANSNQSFPAQKSWWSPSFLIRPRKPLSERIPPTLPLLKPLGLRPIPLVIRRILKKDTKMASSCYFASEYRFRISNNSGDNDWLNSKH